jgi:hypothetical protein
MGEYSDGANDIRRRQPVCSRPTCWSTMRGRSSTWTRVESICGMYRRTCGPPRNGRRPTLRSALCRPENLCELVRRRDFQLIVATVAQLCPAASVRTASRAGNDRPASGRTSLRIRARSTTVPRQDLAGTPAALSPGHASVVGSIGQSRHGPAASRRNSQFANKLSAHRHRERRRDPDVMQLAALVV